MWNDAKERADYKLQLDPGGGGMDLSTVITVSLVPGAHQPKTQYLPQDKEDFAAFWPLLHSNIGNFKLFTLLDFESRQHILGIISS